MTYSEIYDICRKGKIGKIPGWKGYIKYNYSIDLLYFVNGNYTMTQNELKDKISNRTDLYYII